MGVRHRRLDADRASSSPRTSRGWWCASGARSGRSAPETGRVTTTQSASDGAATALDRPQKRTRYIVAAGGCVARGGRGDRAHVVLVRERRLLPHGVRGGEGPDEPGHEPLPARRRGRPRLDPTTTAGGRLRGHRRQEDRDASSTTATRPSCSRTARRSSARASGRRRGLTVRLRPDPDQARQRVQAAEGRHQEGAGLGRARTSREGDASAILGIALGVGASAVGVVPAARWVCARTNAELIAQRAAVRLRRARRPRCSRSARWSGR